MTLNKSNTQWLSGIEPMAKYRVRVVRECIMAEEAYVDVEADTDAAAETAALELAMADEETVEFSTEWLRDTNYDVEGIELIEEE